MADEATIKVDMRGWPASLVEVAEVIGPEAALLLVTHFGGTQVYVPQKLDASHTLARALGLDAAAKLCDRYAREDLHVPTLFAAKGKKVVIAEATGSARAVARKLKVSVQYVRKVRRDTRPDERQDDLFG